jgi:hypothetical protein
MKKTLLILIGLILGLTTSIALLAGHDDREGDEHHEYHESDHDDDDDRKGWLRRFAGSNITAQNRDRKQDPAFGTYADECGDCHMAYPPDMLSKESWSVLMTNLEDHFGDNAELDAETAGEIGRFLERHGARTMDGVQSSKPARISDTRWFRAQHHEIPARMVKNNPGVKSFSRCEACHTRAAEGRFNEHDVRIPGFGYWDD